MPAPLTVNCLIVIDAQGLINDHQGQPSSPTNPIGLSQAELNKRVYMVAGYENVIEGQASSNLNVKVSNGDSIRWTATSLSSDSIAFADLQQFYLRSSNPPNLISPPFMVSSDVWQCVVINPNPGTVTYDWVFAVGWVGANYTHTPMLYFKWDPTITVRARA